MKMIKRWIFPTRQTRMKYDLIYLSVARGTVLLNDITFHYENNREWNICDFQCLPSGKRLLKFSLSKSTYLKSIRAFSLSTDLDQFSHRECSNKSKNYCVEVSVQTSEMLVCGRNIKSFIGFLSVQFALISRDNKYLYVRLGRKINHNVIEYARRCMKIKQSMSLMRQNPRKALINISMVI